MSPSPALSYIRQHSIGLSPWVTFLSDLSRFLLDIYCFHSCLIWSLKYCEVSRTGFIIPISETHTLSSVQSLSCVRLFVTPWTAARQASLSITNAQSLLKLMSIKLVIPSNHLILCHLLLLPPSIFPSIRVFSNESVLHIRRPKYWSFSFSVSPSKEYSGLISFRMDWLDFLAVQGNLKSLLQHHSSKASIFRCSAFFIDTAIDICSFCMPSLPPPLLLTSAAPFPLGDTSCHITFDFDEALIKGYCSSCHYLLFFFFFFECETFAFLFFFLFLFYF